MATRTGDQRDARAEKKRLKNGNGQALLLPGGVRPQTRREILQEAEKIVIKPGMRLVWDEELNRMVWK